MAKEIYTDIEKYIKKEDNKALEKYEVDEEITIILVPYKEISYKADSGYGAYCCELVLDNDEMPDTFTISGNFISQLNIGQTYKARGNVVLYNKKKQLKVEEIKKVEPKTIRTIKQFLKSLEGMGPFYDVIYDEFGEKSLDMIRTNPLEVKKVAPALYDSLVLDWQRQLKELKDSQEYLTALMNYGFKATQAKQFFDLHGELCLSKIQENPYRLITELKGFGFLKCDTIAKNIGYAPDSEIRINEALIYTLNTAKYNGNTYMTKEELLNKAGDLLAIKLGINDMKKLFKSLDGKKKYVIYKLGSLTFQIDAKDIIMAMDEYSRANNRAAKSDAKLVIFNIPQNKIEEQITYLKLEGKLIYDESRGKIYDKALYYYEEFIAQKLLKIKHTEEKIEDLDIEGVLKAYLTKNNIELEAQQYQAVLNSALTIGGFSIINGSAGCVDCDTEFFNGKEWKKISDYKYGDKVLQYNKDNTTTLVQPLRYIKEICNKMYLFKSSKIDMLLSEDHNVIYFDDESNEPHEILVNNLITKIKNKDFLGKIKTTCQSNLIKFSKEDIKNNFVDLNEVNIEEITPIDNFKYCFTVPSHMLVLRRNNKIFITGNCGKTYTLNIALKLIEYAYVKKLGYFEPIVLAPTGRAAKVAGIATKREASTIHKALKLNPETGFFYNAQNHLPYNCIICDETSMLDVEITKHLLEAISNRTKIIFIGDTKQLPSVGPGNVLKDIVNSNLFKVTTLNVVKRQSLDSGIYKNAKRIMEGQMITSEKESKDAFVYKGVENEKVINKILTLYQQLNTTLTLDQIQVLSPQKSGLLGTNYLNFILQDKFNHENIGLRVLNKQITVTLPDGNNGKFELYFKQGDKVIHTENDYTLPWYQLENGKIELDENGLCGISNGEVGRIVKIFETTDENKNTNTMIVVKYDDKYIIYTNDFSKLDHAYCMTIHKSQGSEWPAVLMPITFSSYNMLERNLIYTGYTRAKKWIGVVGDPEAIKYSISVEKSNKRQTGLQDRLQDLAS